MLKKTEAEKDLMEEEMNNKMFEITKEVKKREYEVKVALEQIELNQKQLQQDFPSVSEEFSRVKDKMKELQIELETARQAENDKGKYYQQQK